MHYVYQTLSYIIDIINIYHSIHYYCNSRYYELSIVS